MGKRQLTCSLSLIEIGEKNWVVLSVKVIKHQSPRLEEAGEVKQGLVWGA